MYFGDDHVNVDNSSLHYHTDNSIFNSDLVLLILMLCCCVGLNFRTCSCFYRRPARRVITNPPENFQDSDESCESCESCESYEDITLNIVEPVAVPVPVQVTTHQDTNSTDIIKPPDYDNLY